MKEEQTTETESKENIKKDIDKAEKELTEIFKDFDEGYNEIKGTNILNILASDFNTLLKYAREWQESQEGERHSDDVEKLLELYKYGKENDKQEKTKK